MEEGLQYLLDDARSVGLYGSRAGKLTSPAIFLAIANFERLQRKTWSDPETLALQSALAQAVADIAPVTIIDLRLNNPFAEENRNRRKKYLLIAVSIILMAITAHLTIIYNQHKNFVERAATLREANPETKLGVVARIWQGANITKGTMPAETYFEKLEEVRQLNRQALELTTSLGQLDQTWFSSIAPDWLNFAWLRSIINRISQADQTQLPQPTSGDAAATAPTIPPASKQTGAVTFYCSDLDNVGGGLTDKDKFFLDKPGKQLLENRLLSLKFSCVEGLYLNPASISSILLSENYARQRIVYLNEWLLPALYAALGSLVYYMRSVLNPAMPDPGYDQIAHRVALGAFAGIIFAWFWRPGDGSNTLDLVNVNAFAIAFIIGFSIEIFFTALDRFVAFMQGVVSAPRTTTGVMSLPQVDVMPGSDQERRSPDPSGPDNPVGPATNKFPL